MYRPRRKRVQGVVKLAPLPPPANKPSWWNQLVRDAQECQPMTIQGKGHGCNLKNAAGFEDHVNSAIPTKVIRMNVRGYSTVTMKDFLRPKTA